MTSFITNNPAIVSFQIGVKAALANLPFEDVGPFLRENTIQWINQVDPLEEMGLTQPGFADTGLEKKYYRGITMKLAGCTMEQLIRQNGAYTTHQILAGMIGFDTTQECSRNYHETREDYLQKVSDKHSYTKEKDSIHYNPDHHLYLTVEKKAVTTIFDFSENKEFEIYLDELLDFSQEAQKILAPLHSRQKADQVLNKVIGNKKPSKFF